MACRPEPFCRLVQAGLINNGIFSDAAFLVHSIPTAPHPSPTESFPPVPEHWFVADKDSENGEFGGFLEWMTKDKYKKRFGEARVIFCRNIRTSEVRVRVDHASGFAEAKSTKLPFAIEEVKAELKFKRAAKHKPRFKNLYEKLSDDPNSQIFYKKRKKGDPAKAYIIRVVHKTHSWKLYASDWESGIKEMEEHMEYSETKLGQEPAIGEVWNHIFNELKWYGDCKVFHLVEVSPRDGTSWKIKIDHELYGTEFKQEGKTSTEAAENLLKTMITLKLESFRKYQITDENHVPFLQQKVTWSEATRKTEKGAFATLFRLIQKHYRNAKVWYHRDGKGWTIRALYSAISDDENAKVYEKEDTTKRTLGFQQNGSSLESAVKHMEEHLKFTQVTKKNQNGPVWEEIFRVKILVLRSYGDCKLFIKEDPENSRPCTLKVDHPLWGRQHTAKGATPVTTAEKLLKFLVHDKEKRCQKFMLDAQEHYYSDYDMSSTLASFSRTLVWGEATEEVAGGAFKTLLKELEEAGYKNAKVLFGRDRSGWKVKVNHEQCKLQEESTSLEVAIHSIIYDIPFKEVVNEAPFTKIFEGKSRLHETDKGAKVFLKKDKSALYEDSPSWVIKALSFYGDCRIFYKSDGGGKWVIKVDHPYWGIQCKCTGKQMDEVAKSILDYLDEHKEAAGQEFVWDELRGLSPPSGSIDTRVVWTKATKRAEEKVFEPIFKFIEKKHQFEGAEVFYSKGTKQIKFEHKSRTIVRKSTNLKQTVKDVLSELEFIDVTNSEKMRYKGIINKLPKNEVDNAKIFYKKEDKNEFHTKFRPCYVVRVNHKTYGFRTYGDTLNDAIKEMEKHLAYTEMKEENWRAYHHHNHIQNPQVWESIFKVLENFGQCRLFFKKVLEKKGTSSAVDGRAWKIKVDHELRGILYDLKEEGDTLDQAAEKILKKLRLNETKARKNLCFENIGNMSDARKVRT
ncbi:hypothetical protein DFH11DRAFT_1778880 [Phellopilus nigrolimitatus]|nr:hypothetical protein DFH11DRAFT_1778880 [Phellopilus nigrolimitatus]